jgi:hypothetical protein
MGLNMKQRMLHVNIAPSLLVSLLTKLFSRARKQVTKLKHLGSTLEAGKSVIGLTIPDN